MKKIKLPKQIGWLIPGLQVKRWFALVLIGALLITIGVLILFDIKPVFYTMQFISKVANTVSTEWLAFGIIMIGGAFFFKGWRMTNLSMLDLPDNKDSDVLLENLYRKRKLSRGPKTVAVGGGTGLSMLLSGIKNITNNITAIVSVGDDGGSSGRLRESLGILPPGDIRHCMTALADDEDLVTKLFKFRFDNGEGLEGHSFGNLFLTAMCEITGDMASAVKASANVISMRGRVLPATLDDMKLVAQMKDGSVVHGESAIPEAHGQIERLYSEPADCKALPEVLQAIKDAELIILGPGSLYTSVIPNLLIKEISEEISRSKAKKIYVCNIMTQPGETDGYKVSDHLKALLKHSEVEHLVDAILVNDNIPENCDKYKEQGQYPVILDSMEIKKLGVEIYAKNLIEPNKEGLIRHSSKRVAHSVYTWFKKSQKK